MSEEQAHFALGYLQCVSPGCLIRLNRSQEKVLLFLNQEKRFHLKLEFYCLGSQHDRWASY